MKLIGLFNQDGGTFRTTDMDAYVRLAEETFGKAGHDFEGRIVSGREIVPAGTMNLFARSLRLPLDIWQVLDVLAHGEVDSVDIGSANGRPFIHQYSAGMHARLVRYRNSFSYRSRIGKISASTRAAMGVIFNPPEFDVAFDMAGKRERRRVSALSVSNNPFGQNSLLYADDLKTGNLGFYLAKPMKPLGVTRLAIDMLRGKFRDNADVMVMHTQNLHLHFPKLHHKSNCVIDGELLPLQRDVQLTLHPGELKVIVRQGTEERVAAEAALAEESSSA